MKFLKFASFAAVAMAAALPAQAQTAWYTAPSSWYAGAAGGVSQISITCDAGACQRDSGAWKLYGGFEFPNHTGAEIVYYDLGHAHGDALHQVGFTPGKVDAAFAAIGGTYSPPLGGGFVARLKLGLAVSMTKVSGTYLTQQGSVDRTTFPHVWAAAGLGWKLNDRIEFTADYDYTRAAYRNRVNNTDFHLKQTVDAGGFTIGGQYQF